MKVQLENDVHGLTKGRVYLVLGIASDFLRIQDDEGSPYLYEPKDFVIVEDGYPDFWICKKGYKGEDYYYPEEWIEPGFFEDYFDGVVEARNIFNKVLEIKYGL